MGLIVEISTANDWHVMKADVQYGPFSYAEMLSFLQSKTLFTFDYVWSPHLDSWTMLGELEEFSIDRIHRITEKSSETTVFINRKHDRVNCDLCVYVHDEKQVWTGQVQSISEGGILVLIDNPLFLPGDQLTVHFCKETESRKGLSEVFNSRMEVLNKRLTKQKLNFDTRLHYVLQFKQLPELGTKTIKNFIKTFINAKGV